MSAAAYIEAADKDARAGLMALRALILDVAAEAGIEVSEALRWGQPAFLAPKGSSLRIGLPKAGGFALYVHCQTGLIDRFNAGPGRGFRTEGTRAVLFDTVDELDRGALAPLILWALTYHEKATL